MKKQDKELPRHSPKPHPYLTFFNRHVSQLQEHLTGATHKSVLAPSFINDVYWEVSEKVAFFHSLSVYSRLRPDLIAACVESKNEVEVLEYILLLEEELQEKSSEGEPCRRNMPLAHEVSDAWVAWEEENAARLQANEEIWSEGSAIDTVKDTRDLADGAKEIGMPDLLRDSSFGDIPSLTYGHLVVLDSLLEAKTNEAGNDAACSTGNGISSSQSLIEAGFMPPTRTLQPSASQTSNGFGCSLDQSASILSQPDFDPSGEDRLSLQGLSLRSRRLYRKRMHMRRKRAQVMGVEPDSMATKLPPGRRKQSAENLGKPIATNPDNQDMGTERTVGTAMSGVGDPLSNSLGGRLPYKTIHSDFHRHGINAESIRAVGLDLFNCRKLAKLLRLFVSGYDPGLMSEVASISTETFLLLSEILKDFLVQIISRVIAFEEEHQRLRGNTKVWRKTIDESEKDSIDGFAVQFALKTMGQTNENINQYFAELLDEDHDPPSHQQTGYGDNERIVTTHNLFHQHPLHQDICPPLYHFISACDHSQSSSGVDDEINDLIDIETDEERLESVLEEEEGLEEEDAVADAVYEESLWNEVPLPKQRSR